MLDPRTGRYRVRLSKKAGGGKRAWLKENGRAATYATVEEAETMLAAIALVESGEAGELDTCREAFTKALEARDREPTRRNQKNDWSKFRAWMCASEWIDWPPAAVTTAHGYRWVEKMTSTMTHNKRGEKRIADRATVLAALSLSTVLFEGLVKRNVIASNPFRGVTVPGKSVRREEYFTAVEVVRILQCEAIPPIERALLSFFFGTGGRHDEIFLTPARNVVLDAHEPYWFVEYGARQGAKLFPPKNGKQRRVPLFGIGLAGAQLYRKLVGELAWKNDDALAFPSRRDGMVRDRFRHWYTWLAAAGVRTDYDSYKLRHTCASLLLSGDMSDVIFAMLGQRVPRRRWSLEEIGPVLGHSSIEVTTRYAHLVDGASHRAARETMGQETSKATWPGSARNDEARADAVPSSEGEHARSAVVVQECITGDSPASLAAPAATASPTPLLPAATSEASVAAPMDASRFALIEVVVASVQNDVTADLKRKPRRARRLPGVARAPAALSTRCPRGSVQTAGKAMKTGEIFEPRIGFEPTTAALRKRSESADSPHLGANGGQFAAVAILGLAVLSARAPGAVDDAERVRRASALLLAAAPLMASGDVPASLKTAIAVAREIVKAGAR